MNANERKQHKRQTIKGSLAAHPESTKKLGYVSNRESEEKESKP